MSCIIINPATGENSELYNELVEIFRNEDDAQIAYAKLNGSSFKERFGNWSERFNNEDFEGDVGVVNEKTGEPKIHYDRSKNKWYFVDYNQQRDYLDKMPLSEFSAQEIEEVTNFLLFRFVTEGGEASLNNYDKSEIKEGILMKSIEDSIAYYREEIKDREDKEEYEKRIQMVEESKLEFKKELINYIGKLGKKVTERILDAEGNPENQVSEKDKGGGVNVKDSFETNSKNSATVNTKIMLHQIQERIVEYDSNDKPIAVPIKDGFLGIEVFASFDDVWSTLNKILVDETGYGHGESFMDIYTVMRNKLDNFSNDEAKLWIKDLLDKLNAYEADGDVNKINEFVQAFNKTELNFFVTETNKNAGYKVLNATATNSRKNQLIKKWNNFFSERFLNENGKLSKEEREEIISYREELNASRARFNKAASKWQKEARNNGLDIYDGENLDNIMDAADEAAYDIIDILSLLGVRDIYADDINRMMIMAGGDRKMFETISELYKGIDYTMKEMVENDKRKFTSKNGTLDNIFGQESIVALFAEAVGFRETDIAEASVLLTDGKTGYSITNPTYVSNKINEWKKDPSALEKLSADPSKKNSKWIKYLLALDEQDLDERKRLRNNRLDKFKSGLDASFKSQGKNDAVDNTKITTNDNINANIAQMLNAKIGGESLFPTIIAADKSRRILLSGLPMEDFTFQFNEDGSIYVSPEAIDIGVGYAEDEYRRIQKVTRENANPDIEKIVHYHGEGKNGVKFQIFPEFNEDNTNPELQEVRNILYGENLEGQDGFTKSQKEIIAKHVGKSMEARIREHTDKLSNLDGLSEDLLKSYGSHVNLAGNYFINGLISSVEYTKLFSGDPAYYKSTEDLIKRIPATYTDGLQLRLRNADELIFNQATVEGVEVASRYVEKIRESVKDKSIVKAYEEVNTTDAQAWITPRRWRFLKKGLGQWSPLHDKVFDKMMNGEQLSTPLEMKLAAQPLKGVYFEINDGRPVYLKYSQAVLIPSLVKGTPMEGLYNKMTKNPETGEAWGKDEGHKEIHEVVTIDGIKVGSASMTPINVKGSTDMLSESDIELNVVRLNNRGWKLQQDLPVKLMHETNVGSQIQKNILEGLNLTADYNGKTGEQLLKDIHDTVSKLSNFGKKKLIDRFGIDENGKITNSDSLYNALIDEFKDRGGNENIIDALEKRMPFDAIPQIRGKVESVFMSMMNRALTKISTQGGSFIQVSPFGLETIGVKKERVYPDVEIVKRYNVSDVKNNPNKIYIFGDNVQRKGKGGQAIIRDEENAFGIVTKEEPNRSPSAYMMDDFYDSDSLGMSNQQRIDADIAKIKADGRTVVFPKDGLGTGLAKLKEKAPKTYAYLKKRLLEEFGFNNDTGELSDRFTYKNVDSNITIVSENYNKEGLLPPRIDKKTGKVLPGQAMIPHTYAIELLSRNDIDLKGKSIEEAISLLDPSALEMITYRIPNQGMSSNDYLEIVGILPPGMGDSIVVYDGLPAKTGSDFDIDKLFAMQNHLVLDPETLKLTKLTEENRYILEDAGESSEKIDQMIAENDLVELYKTVLNSPNTYDNMMRSIDGAQLKDDIAGTKSNPEKGLFPAPKMSNMELFSPLKQLQIKSEYLSGKFGVAQTANQLVDHVSNQSLNIRLDKWIGVGNSRTEVINGKEKTITFFDTETQDSHSIADNLSAFLNAYVDIAKDPYIARGNHNSVTANTGFMLIRAGVPLKWVNRFIGQPILKELVALQMEQQSITAQNLSIGEGKEAVFVNPMESILYKYGFGKIPKNVSGKDVAKLNEKELEKNLRNGGQNNEMNYQILKAWSFLSEQSKFFNKGVGAAKSDTAGAGGSNVDRLVNDNKIKEVLSDGVLLGYEAKFKGTMLGTYRENTLNWVKDVVRASDLFLAGTQVAEDSFNLISFQTANGEFLTNLDLAKAIDNNYYSYLMSGLDLFKDNLDDYDYLTRDLPKKVLKLQEKIMDDPEGNFLIKELEIESRGDLKYLGINNKNKPTYYQNKIYRAWMDLYNTFEKDENGIIDINSLTPERELAIDLAKYAFTASGFQNNLAQFFTLMPHQLLKDYNIGKYIKDEFRDGVMDADSNFTDQLQRHSVEDYSIVKSVKLNKMEGNSSGFIYTPAEVKSKELGSVDKSIKGKDRRFFPKFVSSKKSGKVMLFEKIGTVKRVDADNQKIKVPVYVRTFSLGSKDGKYRTFEYSKFNNIKKSKIPSNNLPQEVRWRAQKFINKVSQMEDFESDQSFTSAIESLGMERKMNISDETIIAENFSEIVKDKKIECK